MRGCQHLLDIPIPPTRPFTNHPGDVYQWKKEWTVYIGKQVQEEQRQRLEALQPKSEYIKIF